MPIDNRILKLGENYEAVSEHLKIRAKHLRKMVTKEAIVELAKINVAVEAVASVCNSYFEAYQHYKEKGIGKKHEEFANLAVNAVHLIYENYEKKP